MPQPQGILEGLFLVLSLMIGASILAVGTILICAFVVYLVCTSIRDWWNISGQVYLRRFLTH